MNVKYFQDTDTPYIEFRNHAVTETRDLDADMLLDLDAAGNIVAITVEHAGQRADMALRLARYFGTSAEFWMGLQADHDLRTAEGLAGQMLARIQRREPAPA